MSKCRNCSAVVAGDTTKVCWKCGIENPTQIGNAAAKLTLLVFLIAGVGSCLGIDVSRKKSNEKAPAQVAAQAAPTSEAGGARQADATAVGTPEASAAPTGTQAVVVEPTTLGVGSTGDGQAVTPETATVDPVTEAELQAQDADPHVYEVVLTADDGSTTTQQFKAYDDADANQQADVMRSPGQQVGPVKMVK